MRIGHHSACQSSCLYFAGGWANERAPSMDAPVLCNASLRKVPRYHEMIQQNRSVIVKSVTGLGRIHELIMRDLGRTHEGSDTLVTDRHTVGRTVLAAKGKSGNSQLSDHLEP
jgi:hypothetical protein